MGVLVHSFRHAARRLRRRPGYAVLATLTMAIAVGGNAAIFSIADPVLFRELPYADPDRIVTLDARAPQGFLVSTSVPNYRDWGKRSRVFESYGAAAPRDFLLTGTGDPEVLDGRAVIGDFFGVLGMQAQLGRLTSPPEHEPPAAPVAVLGYEFWVRRLGASEHVIGQSLVLDGRPHVIVGILPRHSGFPSRRTDVYVPMGSIPGLAWQDRDISFGARPFARLMRGVTLGEARVDLARVHRQLVADLGEPVAAPELRLLSDLLLGGFRLQAWLLLGAVGCLLLIAIANVANLQLVRGEARRAEIALRKALGAPTRLIVLETLSESTLIAAIGGVFGLCIGAFALHALVPLMAADIPVAVSEGISMNARVSAFTLIVAATSGGFFGLYPAWASGNSDAAEDLKGGARTVASGSHALRTTLAGAEIALALVLLIGASLMLATLRNLIHVDKGFDARGVVTARVPLPPGRYTTADAWRDAYGALLDRVRALPGVDAAAVTLLLPLSGRSWERGVLPEGRSVHERRESALFGVVSADYFAALGIPLVRGRAFSDADRDATMPVAIIDERMAERFWPGTNPLGKRLFFEVDGAGVHDRAGRPVYRTVVGVVPNLRHYDLASPSRVQIYVPLAQTRRDFGMVMSLAVKTALPPAALVPALRRELAQVDANAPLTDVRPLQDIVDDRLASRRSLGVLLVLFGAVAMSLAAIGVFGVLAYMVSQRARDIAIRMALGADAGRILWLVFAHGGILILCGVAAGLAASIGLTRTLGGFLYGVSPLEPGLYAAITAFLVVTAGLAVVVPAIRAVRLDPGSLLREDRL